MLAYQNFSIIHLTLKFDTNILKRSFNIFQVYRNYIQNDQILGHSTMSLVNVMLFTFLASSSTNVKCLEEKQCLHISSYSLYPSGFHQDIPVRDQFGPV